MKNNYLMDLDVKICQKINMDENYENTLLNALLLCNLSKCRTEASFCIGVTCISAFSEIKFDEINYFKRISNNEYHDKILKLAFNDNVETILKVRLFHKDVKTNQKIKQDEQFSRRLFNLSRICKEKNIDNWHLFNEMKTSSPLWYDINFDQMGYFERIIDNDYLNLIQEYNNFTFTNEEKKKKTFSYFKKKV